jgi:hypothetical protein
MLPWPLVLPDFLLLAVLGLALASSIVTLRRWMPQRGDEWRSLSLELRELRKITRELRRKR